MKRGKFLEIVSTESIDPTFVRIKDVMTMAGGFSHTPFWHNGLEYHYMLELNVCNVITVALYDTERQMNNDIAVVLEENA